jgi:CSLREA domain-containing protein
MKKTSVLLQWVFIVMLGLSSSPAYAMPVVAGAAPTFTVNSLADVAGYAGDTVCETAPGDSICTLRAAVMAANHLPGGNATIKIPAGTFKMILGPTGADDETTGDYNLSNSVTIIGAGEKQTILDLNGLDRAFSIAPGIVATISGLTIENGYTMFDPAIYSGGGIFNQGTLSLTTVIINGNTAYQGGGIFTTGSMRLDASQISNNASVEGPASEGGGIYVANTSVWITSTTIDANSSYPANFDVGGGGIYCQFGTLTLSTSTLSGNSINPASAVFASGGGLQSLGCSITITASTVSNNSSTNTGGGIQMDGTTATLELINSTVAENDAPNGGGGIDLGSGTAHLGNATIAYNQSKLLHTGAGVANKGGQMYLTDTFLAENFEPRVVFPFYFPDDCKGTLVSANYNLISTLTDCIIVAGTGDKLGVSAILEPMGFNGGPTQTMALPAGSPAIGAGNPFGCRNQLGNLLTTDQRGFPRQVFRDGQMRCDIGAYQAQLMTYLPLLRK